MVERVNHGVDGLHFEVGSEAGLARVMQRAATEAGLWERLVTNLPKPANRDDMVNGFCALYGGPPIAAKNIQPAPSSSRSSPRRQIMAKSS
jgi:hypothetical protein